MQVIEFAHRLDAKIAADRLNLQNFLLISLLAGNLTVETGLTATASATIRFLRTANLPLGFKEAGSAGIFATRLPDFRSLKVFAISGGDF